MSPDTLATSGLLLVTATGVAAAASAESSCSAKVACAAGAVISRPADGAASSTTPIGCATIGGSVPGAGGPTTIVSSRT